MCTSRFLGASRSSEGSALHTKHVVGILLLAHLMARIFLTAILHVCVGDRSSTLHTHVSSVAHADMASLLDHNITSEILVFKLGSVHRAHRNPNWVGARHRLHPNCATHGLASPRSQPKGLLQRVRPRLVAALAVHSGGPRFPASGLFILSCRL